THRWSITLSKNRVEAKHDVESISATSVHHVLSLRTRLCVRGSAFQQGTHALTTVNTTFWKCLLASYRKPGAGRETEEDSAKAYWKRLYRFLAGEGPSTYRRPSD